MCGRFVQALDPADYADYFGADLAISERLAPSYNVAPTDRVYAVAEHDDRRLLGAFRWGLIPWWAKDIKIGAKHINARAETLATKAAFKDSFARKRCIVPADGFFEWERRADGSKLPHYIHRPGAPIGFAGLWASWRDPSTEERLTSCTIITTDPNELLEPIHNRMPVILGPEHWDAWLDREVADLDQLAAMLQPAPEGLLGEYPVSTLDNSVKNNFAECIEPLH